MVSPPAAGTDTDTRNKYDNKIKPVKWLAHTEKLSQKDSSIRLERVDGISPQLNKEEGKSHTRK